MQYRSQIDGLRAVAVLPVLLFHAGIDLFSGGYVGVDIFFVISGYLITTIIINDLEKKNFNLVHFYEKRARRILPALYLVMLVSLPFAWQWLLPNDMKNFSQSLVAASVFASNILFFIESGYFESGTELKPLLHTWSLAVEEQYYVLFPIMLLFTWRLGKQFIIILLTVIFSISIIEAHNKFFFNSVGAFYLLPTRIWEILLGSFVAFYLSKKNKIKINNYVMEIFSILGMLLILYSIFVFDKKINFPSFYTLIPTLGTALIIIFTSKETFLGKLLSKKFFVGVGLISYSTYLWHQPILAFVEHRSIEEPSKLLLLYLIALSMGLAFLTWKFVEIPFKNSNFISRKAFFLTAILGTFFFISIGLMGQFSNGFQNRLSKLFNVKDIEMSKLDNGGCFYSVDSILDLTIGKKGTDCWLGKNKSKIKGILFGDSYAGHYEPMWDEVGKKIDFSLNSITTNWCFPSLYSDFTGPLSSRALKQCIYNRNYIVNNIEKYDFLVLGGSWGDILTQNKIESVLKFISFAAKKTKLVILMPTPKQFDVDVTSLYMRSVLHNTYFDISSVPTKRDKKAVEADMIIQKFVLKFKNVKFIDRQDLFKLNGKPSDLTKDGIPFSLEGNHISIYGAKKLIAPFQKTKVYYDFLKLFK